MLIWLLLHAGAELNQLFSNAPSFEVSFDSEDGSKRLVDVLHEAKIFSSLGKLWERKIDQTKCLSPLSRF